MDDPLYHAIALELPELLRKHLLRDARDGSLEIKP